VLLVNVIPAGLPASVWEWLFTEAELPAPRRLAQRLQTWSDLQLGAVMNGERLEIHAVLAGDDSNCLSSS